MNNYILNLTNYTVSGNNNIVLSDDKSESTVRIQPNLVGRKCKITIQSVHMTTTSKQGNHLEKVFNPAFDFTLLLLMNIPNSGSYNSYNDSDDSIAITVPVTDATKSIVINDYNKSFFCSSLPSEITISRVKYEFNSTSDEFTGKLIPAIQSTNNDEPLDAGNNIMVPFSVELSIDFYE